MILLIQLSTIKFPAIILTKLKQVQPKTGLNLKKKIEFSIFEKLFQFLWNENFVISAFFLSS